MHNKFLVIILTVLILLSAILCITDFRYDATAARDYSLAPQTKQLLAELSQPITLYVLRNPDGEDYKISLLLKSYAEYSKLISIVTVDTAIQPDVVMRLSGNVSVTPGTIFAEGAAISQANPESFYTYDIDYTTMQRRPAQFCGQSVLNGLIAAADCKDIPLLYILAGHGEQELPSSFFTRLRRDGIQPITLNLLKGDALPSVGDANSGAIFINVPSDDITDGERLQLENFIALGGAVFLVAPYTIDEMPNVTKLATAFNIIPEHGVLRDTDSLFSVQNNASYLRPLLHAHKITDPLIALQKTVVMVNAGALRITNTENVTVLLSASSSAERAVSQEPHWNAEPHAVVAAAATNNVGGKLLIATSAALTDETCDQLLTAGGNSAFVMNCITWLTEGGNSWSIQTDSTETDYLVLSSQQANILTAISVILLPSLCFAVAMIIRKMRRRR